ncbi:MAG: hypoxanthine phosphoribosyltransferase [Victivallaceae bacterium]|nr:hypoxanthine phosphoribosyltransferase [Victivallaceae bacterium]
MKYTDCRKNHNILLSRKKIGERVAELGKSITEHYREKEITVLALTNGALVFAADIIRQIKCPLRLDTFTVASYTGDGSSGDPVLRSEPGLDIAGRHVLIVDDILDTGLTLHKVKVWAEKRQAASVSICVLLDKQVPHRKLDIEVNWYGFRIPDTFVYGYGMDNQNGLFRNLPCIAHIAV